MAQITYSTLQSNDYVIIVRLVDKYSSIKWVDELIIYIWSDWYKHIQLHLSYYFNILFLISHSQYHIPNTS